ILQHDWPLNIRELDKCIEVALVLAQSGEIKVEHLASALRFPSQPAAGTPGPTVAAGPTPDASQQTPDQRTQRPGELPGLHDGNIARRAREVDRAPLQIRRWCHSYGLDPNRFRRRDDEPA